ncbi:hypothetical protein Tco_0702584 [Tanacetum coccineum]|uniref:Uncharacterized protein n=1 Tax=Tanacetum coccineum TaxID=301880 RepID=A0ABQ4XXY0_9ASTR
MCTQSRGRSSYVRAMIDLRAIVELKDTLVVEIQKIKGDRQAIRGVHIGSKSHLAYKSVQPKNDMKTDFKQPKPKVPSATKVVNVTTTSNSFDAFGSMGDVENARVVSHFNAVREKEVNN